MDRTKLKSIAYVCAELAAFATLLFVTRFVARGHLVPQTDQECHIGGIAVDVLAHGIRFPLLVYAPNEYDNGSFFSGLLAAASFSLFGRSVLALKLVTHFIVAAGAVATLWLLRGCLGELRVTARRARWTATAALVIAIAMAPRVVTIFSTHAVGNHAEGSAIDTILLALFSSRPHTRSATRTAAFWALVGFALFLNKGTVLVIPVLAAVEIALLWPARRFLAAAFGGFAFGFLPEAIVLLQRRGMGWVTMLTKGERNVHSFPRGFLDTLTFLGDYRIELLALWALAILVGVALLLRSWRETAGALPLPRSHGLRHGPCAQDRPVPVTLALVVGVTWAHLAALTVMAKSGLDAYVIYAYPTLAVQFAVLVALIAVRTAARWGEGAGAWASGALIVTTLLVYRPDAISGGFAKVSALWADRTGAVCSWRFAEGFERERDHALAPTGKTREEHAIERCRTLSEQTQILDCIGGIARELGWRRRGKVDGEPPPGLSPEERRAYAYYYGTHRKGDIAACRGFASPEMETTCKGAVQLECLHFGDLYTRIASGRGIGAPRCAVAEPPFDGYWAAIRREPLARPMGLGPDLTRAWGDDDLRACKPVFDACY